LKNTHKKFVAVVTKPTPQAFNEKKMYSKTVEIFNRIKNEEVDKTDSKIALDAMSEIIECGNCKEHRNKFYKIEEKMDGDLNNILIENVKNYQMCDVPTLFLPILKLIQFLHKFKIIHRDIKPANILIKINPETGNIINLKLIDFGIALDLSNVEGLFDENNNPLDQQVGGTPGYIPPESFSENESIQKNNQLLKSLQSTQNSVKFQEKELKRNIKNKILLKSIKQKKERIKLLKEQYLNNLDIPIKLKADIFAIGVVILQIYLNLNHKLNIINDNGVPEILKCKSDDGINFFVNNVHVKENGILLKQRIEIIKGQIKTHILKLIQKNKEEKKDNGKIILELLELKANIPNMNEEYFPFITQFCKEYFTKIIDETIKKIESQKILNIESLNLIDNRYDEEITRIISSFNSLLLCLIDIDRQNLIEINDGLKLSIDKIEGLNDKGKEFFKGVLNLIPEERFNIKQAITFQKSDKDFTRQNVRYRSRGLRP
ncbi:unnamed protein product, partial [marine sediment metagenome]